MITLLAVFSLLASAAWGQTCLKKNKLKNRVGRNGELCNSYETLENCNKAYQNITMQGKIHAVPCAYDTQKDTCGFDSNCAIKHNEIDWPEQTAWPTAAPTKFPTIDINEFGDCFWYKNRNWKGVNRDTLFNVQSPRRCMQKCAQHLNCQYWAHYVVNNVGTCRLNWGKFEENVEDLTATSGPRCTKDLDEVTQMQVNRGECVGKNNLALQRVADGKEGIVYTDLAEECAEQEGCIGWSRLGSFGFLHVPKGTKLNVGLQVVTVGQTSVYNVVLAPNTKGNLVANRCVIKHPLTTPFPTNAPTRSPITPVTNKPTKSPVAAPTKPAKTRKPTNSGDKKKKKKIKITLRLKKKIKKTVKNINDILNAIINTLGLKPEDIDEVPTVDIDEDTGKATIKFNTDDEIVAEEVEEKIAEEEFVEDVQEQLDQQDDTEVQVVDAEEEVVEEIATPEPTPSPTAPPTGTCDKFISVPKDVVLVLDSSKSMYTKKGRSGEEEANWNSVLTDIGEVICIQEQGNNCAFTEKDKLGFVQFSKNRITRMDVQGVDWWTTIKINDQDMQRSVAGFETDTVRALWAAFDMLSAVPVDNKKTVRQIVLITDGVPKCSRQRRAGDCSPCHASNKQTTLFKQLQAQADVKLIFRGDRTTHDKATIGESYLRQDAIFGCIVDFDDDTKFTFIEDFKDTDFVNALKGEDVCEDHLE